MIIFYLSAHLHSRLQVGQAGVCKLLIPMFHKWVLHTEKISALGALCS